MHKFINFLVYKSVLLVNTIVDNCVQLFAGKYT